VATFTPSGVTPARLQYTPAVWPSFKLVMAGLVTKASGANGGTFLAGRTLYQLLVGLHNHILSIARSMGWPQTFARTSHDGQNIGKITKGVALLAVIPFLSMAWKAGG
jgi:hypothetical protein